MGYPPQGQASPVVLSKVKAATRDMAASSGDVSYTEIGFCPSVIIAIAAYAIGIVGVGDSAKAVGSIYSIALGTEGLAGATLIHLENAAGGIQTAIIKSYDADGFTLTWTKTGSPTGVKSIYFLCLK